MFEFSNKFCNVDESLDLKDDTQTICSPDKSCCFESLFMFEPKQFLHHNKAGDLCFKLTYISIEVVV